jgi:uncharacterized protein (TIGR00251 family)
VAVKVRAATSRVIGSKNDRLEVAIAAPPVDGAANDALRRVLARHFQLRLGQVQIVAGAHHRHKRVELAEVDEARVRGRLAP